MKSKLVKRRVCSVLLTIAMVLSLMPYSKPAAAENASGSVNTSGGAVADYVVTETELTEAGTDWKSASKCTVYVKITTGSSMSVLQATGEYGEDVEIPGKGLQPLGKTSSKYLAGRNNTLGKSGNVIQDDIIGKAGSGIYKFPEVALNASNKTEVTSPAWSDSQKDYVTIKLLHWTDDIQYELLGIVFNNKAAYPAGFKAPSNVESATLDVKEEKEETAEALLKKSLDYADKMDSSKYQTESWEAFQTELSAARLVYDSGNAAQDQLKKARAQLERVKSKLLFVDSEEAANPMPFRQLTNEQVLKEMGVGINLGNTMDGHSGFTPSETAWQSTRTTKAIIRSMHDAGFNTVRIPVTWGNMIDAENGYQINTNWISRVQEIVDYCVSQDMYAIINVHHDGAEQTGWLRVAADDIDPVYEEFECVWRNIAEYFKDYDEHLIFESMNEITCMEGDNKNSAAAIDQDTPVIVNLNQIFVNVVRSTGSNNSKRWLAAVAHYANSGNHKEFSLPEDSYNQQNALMFGAHVYKASTNTIWTYNEVYEVVNSLKLMANKFDVPLYLGEYGTRTYEQAGTESGYNDVARAYYSEIVHRACKKAGCVPIVWDQGAGNKGELETGLYHFWDRTECASLFKTITDAMVRGTNAELTELNQKWDFSDVAEGVTVTEMTEVVPSETKLSLMPGERSQLTVETAPEGSNDVVLWRSGDDSIVTVYNGLVHAKALGSTTIYAFTQSGSLSREIPVTVTANHSETAATAIETDQDSYEIVKGGSTTIKTSLIPANSQDVLSYRSANEKIATVNAVGRVVAAREGKTLIIITAASGVTKVVPVEVINTVKKDEMNLAIHALYNDSSLNYWGTELGDVQCVKKEDGDREYTLELDLAKNMSAAGKAAGITALKNLTSIYIKDYDVTKGSIRDSNVSKATIQYKKVVVNGNKELTIAIPDSKSAMNSSVFDCGGPVNGYDSQPVLSEVTASGTVANFTLSEPVTKISITFLLTDMVWRDDGAEDVSAASITSDVRQLTINGIGKQQQITAAVTPAESNSMVSFVSSDASVVAVDPKARSITGGKAEAVLTAVAAGTTTVTAYTDNGLTLEYQVTVTEGGSNPGPDETAAPTEPAGNTTPPPAKTPGSSSIPSPTGVVQPTVQPSAVPSATQPAGNVAQYEKGDTVKTADASYTVTDADARTVEYKAPAKKTVAGVTIGATINVTKDGRTLTYKITSVADNAFKNCKKMTSVVLGKNIQKVGKNAFSGCKSLKKINIKGKQLKKIGKNAFKGINKKAAFTVPKAKQKAYKKLLNKKTGYKKTMKIKKA